MNRTFRYSIGLGVMLITTACQQGTNQEPRVVGSTVSPSSETTAGTSTGTATGTTTGTATGTTTGTTTGSSPSSPTAIEVKQIDAPTDLGVSTSSLWMDLVEKTMSLAGSIFMPSAHASEPQKYKDFKSIHEMQVVPNQFENIEDAPVGRGPRHVVGIDDDGAFPVAVKNAKQKFMLFEPAKLKKALVGTLGQAKYDELVSAVKLNASTKEDQLPAELKQSVKFNLDCGGIANRVSFSASVRDVLASEHMGIICQEGRAYLGSTLLPAISTADPAVSVMDLTGQKRLKRSSGAVFMGGKKGNKHSQRVSQLVLDSAKSSFKFVSVSGLKASEKAMVLLTPELAKAINQVPLASKAVLVANHDASKKVSSIELVNLDKLQVNPVNVLCSSVISAFSGLSCKFDPGVRPDIDKLPTFVEQGTFDPKNVHKVDDADLDAYRNANKGKFNGNSNVDHLDKFNEKEVGYNPKDVKSISGSQAKAYQDAMKAKLAKQAKIDALNKVKNGGVHSGKFDEQIKYNPKDVKSISGSQAKAYQDAMKAKLAKQAKIDALNKVKNGGVDSGTVKTNTTYSRPKGEEIELTPGGAVDTGVKNRPSVLKPALTE